MAIKVAGTTVIDDSRNLTNIQSINTTVSATEISYLDGVTSSIQTQLNNRVEKDSNTGAALLPSGTTAQRPAAGAAKLRFNTTLAKFEGHNGTAWGSLGGATGGGNDAVFYVNGTTVTTNYTIPAGQNAMSAGPITIADGVTVTVPDNSNWSVI